MALNRTIVGADPARVFAVLADPCTYRCWVVGNKRVRGHDDAWPETGAELHHTVGVGFVSTDDKTVVVEADPPRRLVLRARAMPIGVGTVTFLLEPVTDGTRVTMEEHPVGGPVLSLWNSVLDRLTWARNWESLRRLKRLAESTAVPLAPAPASDA